MTTQQQAWDLRPGRAVTAGNARGVAIAVQGARNQGGNEPLARRSCGMPFYPAAATRGRHFRYPEVETHRRPSEKRCLRQSIPRTGRHTPKTLLHHEMQPRLQTPPGHVGGRPQASTAGTVETERLRKRITAPLRSLRPTCWPSTCLASTAGTGRRRSCRRVTGGTRAIPLRQFVPSRKPVAGASLAQR